MGPEGRGPDMRAGAGGRMTQRPMANCLSFYLYLRLPIVTYEPSTKQQCK